MWRSTFTVLQSSSAKAHRKILPPVVQKTDSAIQWMSFCPLDYTIGFLILIRWIVIYPVDSVTFEQSGSRETCVADLI